MHGKNAFQVRSSSITLLGRLFASQHAEYGTEVPKIWVAFLGRFKDVDPKVRVEGGSSESTGGGGSSQTSL